MLHYGIFLAVIWIAYAGVVGTVASAGASERLTGAVATGGVFLGMIASLVLFA